MIVGVSGFGSTGSGAVMDYLREFEEISAGGDMELSFLYDPDGVLELEDRLVNRPIRFYSGDAAIKRFRNIIYSYDLKRYAKRFLSVEEFYRVSDEYINSLIKMKYDGGLWHFDRRIVGKLGHLIKYELGRKYLRVFDKLNKQQPRKFLGHCMYIPIHNKDVFIKNTQKYISDLINIMCDTSKPIIALDQPFPSNNPECCFKYFKDDCKAIIVNRDPRDVYLISKQLANGWEMRFTPTFDVEEFIIFYRDQMEIISNLSEKVLYVQFEDLIYDYENTTNKIDNFLKIKKHTKKKKYFDPSISIANTQLYLRFPEMKKDIERIENELSEYLYNFDPNKANLNAKLWAFKEEVQK